MKAFLFLALFAMSTIALSQTTGITDTTNTVVKIDITKPVCIKTNNGIIVSGVASGTIICVYLLNGKQLTLFVSDGKSSQINTKGNPVIIRIGKTYRCIR